MLTIGLDLASVESRPTCFCVFKELKIEGLTLKMSDHELGAVSCAYVGKLFSEGQTRLYGTPDQDVVMLNT